MIELLLGQAGDSTLEQHFLQELSAHLATVTASVGDRMLFTARGDVVAELDRGWRWHGRDDSPYHPVVHAQPPHSLEPLALEHQQSPAVQERGGDLAPSDVLWVRLHRPATEPGNRRQSGRQRHIRNPALSIALTHEEARDPPIR